MDEIKDLIMELNSHMKTIKDIKSELKEKIEDTDMYKAVFEATMQTSDSSNFQVAEKDAAKHAYNVTLKNLKKSLE